MSNEQFLLLSAAEQRVSGWGGSDSDPVHQHAVVQRVGELCEGQRQRYDPAVRQTQWCIKLIFASLRNIFYNLFSQSRLVPSITVKLALWKEDTYNSNKVNISAGLKGPKVEWAKQTVNKFLYVRFSHQVPTMVRSQRRRGSTCWVFMAEALRSQWDKQWPRPILTAFTERGRSRQRPEHFEMKRGWNVYLLGNTKTTIIPHKNSHSPADTQTFIQSRV